MEIVLHACLAYAHNGTASNIVRSRQDSMIHTACLFVIAPHAHHHLVHMLLILTLVLIVDSAGAHQGAGIHAGGQGIGGQLCIPAGCAT